MELGLGVIGYAPSEFWDLSLIEWHCALSGMFEKHGQKTKPSVAPMDKDRMDELLQQFPDGPLPQERRQRLKRERAGIVQRP